MVCILDFERRDECIDSTVSFEQWYCVFCVSVEVHKISSRIVLRFTTSVFSPVGNLIYLVLQRCHNRTFPGVFKSVKKNWKQIEFKVPHKLLL